MNASQSNPQPSTPRQRRNALIAVACATMIQVGGQLLIKQGANLLKADLGRDPSLVETLIAMFTVLPLFLGYSLYGLFTLIMVFALKHAELSLLYPIMALSYIWVPVISVLWLGEPFNAAEVAGVLIIVAGIAVLGKTEGSTPSGEAGAR